MENADFMIEIYRKSKQLDRDLDVCFMIGYDKEIHKANHRP